LTRNEFIDKLGLSVRENSSVYGGSDNGNSTIFLQVHCNQVTAAMKCCVCKKAIYERFYTSSEVCRQYNPLGMKVKMHLSCLRQFTNAVSRRKKRLSTRRRQPAKGGGS